MTLPLEISLEDSVQNKETPFLLFLMCPDLCGDINVGEVAEALRESEMLPHLFLGNFIDGLFDIVQEFALCFKDDVQEGYAFVGSLQNVQVGTRPRVYIESFFAFCIHVYYMLLLTELEEKEQDDIRVLCVLDCEHYTLLCEGLLPPGEAQGALDDGKVLISTSHYFLSDQTLLDLLEQAAQDESDEEV